MFKLRIEAEVRYTEDLDRVVKSIKNLFNIDHYDIDSRGSYPIIIAETRNVRSLQKFHELLRKERILDSARKVLEHGKRGNIILFKLHKQSAYAGHLSFVGADGESPLGPIKVKILTDKVIDLIDWLTPRTYEGKPIREKSIPKV